MPKILLLNLFYIALTQMSAAAESQHTHELPPHSLHYSTFKPIERNHSFSEGVSHVGFIYGLSIGGYLFLHRDAIQKEGSWEKYRNHFGNIDANDHDRFSFNWGTHVFTGSQSYLFFRSQSYSKIDALALTALQSALFEFTIEIYTERASAEDLINTPLLGSALGVLLETTSLKLLNSESRFSRVLGYLLNPPALLGLHEGEVKASPIVTSKYQGLALEYRF
jgi:hypothetical protein